MDRHRKAYCKDCQVAGNKRKRCARCGALTHRWNTLGGVTTCWGDCEKIRVLDQRDYEDVDRLTTGGTGGSRG